MQGDVILSAGGDPVGDAAALSEAWAEAREAGGPLLLRIDRDGNSLFVAVDSPTEE